MLLLIIVAMGFQLSMAPNLTDEIIRKAFSLNSVYDDQKLILTNKTRRIRKKYNFATFRISINASKVADFKCVRCQEAKTLYRLVYEGGRSQVLIQEKYET